VDVVADGGRTASLGHRKMTTSGRRTRDRIVQVAADLMFIHGVAGTSIPDVQGAARVTARLSGKRVEALSERTETSTTE
jgi:hypothetical protein